MSLFPKTTFPKTTALSATFAVVATLAIAGSHGASPTDHAVKARQAQMTLYAFNIGVLGAMAKGEVDYNAEVAGGAAANLAALASVWMPGAWPEGSDNATIEGTAALPALWENMADVGAKSMGLSKATSEMADMAGTDLAGLRSSIGAVGKACGACHKSYRAEKD